MILGNKKHSNLYTVTNAPGTWTNLPMNVWVATTKRSAYWVVPGLGKGIFGVPNVQLAVGCLAIGPFPGNTGPVVPSLSGFSFLEVKHTGVVFLVLKCWSFIVKCICRPRAFLRKLIHDMIENHSLWGISWREKKWDLANKTNINSCLKTVCQEHHAGKAQQRRPFLATFLGQKKTCSALRMAQSCWCTACQAWISIHQRWHWLEVLGLTKLHLKGEVNRLKLCRLWRMAGSGDAGGWFPNLRRELPESYSSTFKWCFLTNPYTVHAFL